jgi:hypothetical protein
VRRTVVLLVAVLLGCSSTTARQSRPTVPADGQPTASVTSPSTAPVTGQATVRPCPDGALALVFLGTSAAAGTVLGTFSVRNQTAAECVVSGYPQIGASAAGTPLAVRTSDGVTTPGLGGYGANPEVVDLKPGSEARFVLVWSDVHPPCLEPSQWDVQLPGERRALPVSITSPRSVSICSVVQVSSLMAV